MPRGCRFKSCYPAFYLENEMLKYKLDYFHHPQLAKPPCPYQKDMTPPHKGKPAEPEFRFYWRIFDTKQKAQEYTKDLNLEVVFPDYRIAL